VSWQVLPYARQLEIKSRLVEEALRRIGRLSGFELQQIVPAVAPWRYRNKLEYSFGEREEGRLICGLHAPAGRNEVVAIEACLLASGRGTLAREMALGWCRSEGLRAWDRGRGARGVAGAERADRTEPANDGRARLRNLVVREGRRTGALQIRVVTTAGELD